MADGTIASIVPLHQPPAPRLQASPETRLQAGLVTSAEPRRAKTPAERAKAYRQRKKARGPAEVRPVDIDLIVQPLDEPAPGPENLQAVDVSPQRITTIMAPPVTVPAVTPVTVVTGGATSETIGQFPAILPGNGQDPWIAPLCLRVAALALAAVGITMNGWFARSLGSSDVAGWLFLAVGVAADAAALVLPTVAAGQFFSGKRFAALAGWLVWLMTFAFAVTASVGFASTNIADVTMARANRVTPKVTETVEFLRDAMTARDRECRGGVGKFCRERETAVETARHALADSMGAVAGTADPQAAGLVRLIRWASGGLVRPTEDDIAMVRLLLLALLPQVGGILLMVARR